MKQVHAIGHTLRALKGNQKACVVTEALWAVPYHLFLPFFPIYMASIGLTELQIGAIASINLASQFIWGLLSGAIVDKYGRRLSMLVFNLLSWGIPCILWATAQNYWYFAAAAALNGMWRVTGNSFGCLMVEDGEDAHLIHIYAIMNMVGLAAGFLSPFTSVFIGRFSLVPTVRTLYLIAVVLMTAKFILQHHLCYETAIGKARIAACKGKSLRSLVVSGWPNFVAVLKNRRVLLCLILMALMNCFNTTQGSFWPLYVTQAYGVKSELFAYFPLLKTIVTILAYFLITSRINLRAVKAPLIIGLASQGMGLVVLLLFRPVAQVAIGAVIFSSICDSFALALLIPLTESLMALSLPQAERAGINSFIYAFTLLVSAPIGWIAGEIAAYNRAYPLVMNLFFVAAQVVIALLIAMQINKER